jgi:hypothetical protein
MQTQVAQNWEARFSNWKGKASDSEQDRYERTCRAIGEALRASPRLERYDFTVYPKGSYPNFTNVVRDSDVDIAVELTTFFKPNFRGDAEGLTLADVGFSVYQGDATLAGFKDDVQLALIAYFGANAVSRGSKAIRVAENSGRLPADVVPCVTERTWTNRWAHHDGIRLLNDRDPAERIVNYPKQHLEQGTYKNDQTSLRYKRVVRILKRLENKMVEDGIIEVVPSFLIESAVWNAPNWAFGLDSWVGRIREVLAHIYNGTMTSDCVDSADWLEANGIKFLFWSGQNWNHQDAHYFASKAWEYLELD